MSDATTPPGAPVRWGIVGAGMIAGYHAQAIRATEGAELVAVCRSRGGDVADAAARFGVVCEPSYDALLARPDIDVVSICTPSGDHAPQAMAAARAGKHVLVEKPMALRVADADAMIEACRHNDVLLAVALQRRTMPALRAVHDAIAAGDLGRLVLGTVSVPYRREAAYYRSADWRGTWTMDGGGALMNQGIHLVDLLLWFMGDAADDVRAHAATLVHPIEVEDCVSASIRFGNGALGSIVATTAAAPGFPHRVDVYGDRGGVQIEGERVVRWEMVDDAGERRVVHAANDGAPEAAGAGANPSGISAEGHTRIVEDLVEAIRAKRPPMITGEEGRRSLALVCAIYDAGWNA